MRGFMIVVALGSAVIAVAVVAFPRLEQYLEDGFDHAGRVKVVDLSGASSQAMIEMPIGYVRRFLIAHPAASAPDSPADLQFRGRLSLEIDGEIIYSLAVDSATATACDWLDHLGHTASILDMGAPKPLDNIEAGTPCKVTVEMEELLERQSSIWLTYVYKPRDLKKQTKV
jgi:hypothetical protein